MIKREPGFYWVRVRGEWAIATHNDGEHPTWDALTHEGHLIDISGALLSDDIGQLITPPISKPLSVPR